MNRQERMKELVELLNKASKAYYQDAEEIMSNYEYDKLYDELQELERELGITLSNSPTVRVGYEVVSELPKERHESPMLSLDKTKDVEELKNFVGDQKALMSWKMDGLTIVLTYRDGHLFKAVTRGNGEVGEVITNNAKVFKNVPLQISYQGELILRGEAVIGYKDFEKINEQIQEAEEKRARLVRLVGEERGKYSAERDKLVRREGAIADDLKRIREKRLDYEKEGIEEVMRRVAGEAALLHEQDSLKQTYAELTATYRNVLQKYDLLVGKVEAAFTAFENERRKAVLARENELNVWRNELYARYREQEVHVRNMYEERQKTWNENRIRLTEEISALRQQKIRIQLTCHFEKETGDYQEQLDALKDEERQTSWQVAGLKLTCDQLRQKCSDEMKESEWQFKQEAEELVRRRTALDEEIQTLTSLLGRWKGSFCEWLDAHKPGWQETIGKVADEELILYAQDWLGTVTIRCSAYELNFREWRKNCVRQPV